MTLNRQDRWFCILVLLALFVVCLCSCLSTSIHASSTGFNTAEFSERHDFHITPAVLTHEQRADATPLHQDYQVLPAAYLRGDCANGQCAVERRGVAAAATESSACNCSARSGTDQNVLSGNGPIRRVLSGDGPIRRILSGNGPLRQFASRLRSRRG